jgi:hypothetical protein
MRSVQVHRSLVSVGVTCLHTKYRHVCQRSQGISKYFSINNDLHVAAVAVEVHVAGGAVAVQVERSDKHARIPLPHPHTSYGMVATLRHGCHVFPLL